LRVNLIKFNTGSSQYNSSQMWCLEPILDRCARTCFWLYWIRTNV